jgi:hypothetical protein
VDVKIRRTMTLQNLTQMPASFSFDLKLLNAWSAGAMSVDVVPDKGELEPSECIELMVEFWPRQVRQIIGCAAPDPTLLQSSSTMEPQHMRKDEHVDENGQ